VPPRPVGKHTGEEDRTVRGSHPRVEGIAYFVCATQRSGSTLLCELLKGTDVAGVPDEFFESLRSTGLPRQPRQYFLQPEAADIAERLAPLDPGRTEQPGEFAGWFDYVLRSGTTPNGVFGSKMMWNYFDDFRARIAELDGLGDLTFTEALDEVFPNLKLLYVQRRDKVAQAVSLWKAIQTQQWRTASEAPDDRSDVEYDYRALRFLVDDLYRWDARWEEWFDATGREPIRVVYEEFVRARAATVGRVLDGLGDPVPGRQPSARARLTRRTTEGRDARADDGSSAGRADLPCRREAGDRRVPPWEGCLFCSPSTTTPTGSRRWLASWTTATGATTRWSASAPRSRRRRGSRSTPRGVTTSRSSSPRSGSRG
jgi:LPS sulfotransferase NodH